MLKAKSSGVRLSASDASMVKGMLKRGDRHHDIAAWFGVNQGRIAEVSKGSLHGGVKTAPANMLPPVGPYSSGQSAHAAMAALMESRKTLEAAIKKIDDVLSKLK